MTRAPLRLGAVLVLLLALAAGGCADRKERYCNAVQDHQQELSELLGGDGADALLRALPIFRDLADDAPDDLRDEWKTVIDALTALEQALEDAGVDPATYDRSQPPEGLSQAEQDAIDVAARGLTTEQVAAAFSGVDQQAKDVCGTPLVL